MKNVGIICGGFSSEFAISIKSATNIQQNFPEGYTPYLVILKREGWFVQMEDDHLIPLDSRDLSFEWKQQTIKIDLAIVYIHGDPGENGKVQAYLEMINIPYINSGPLASQLSFDKWYCNQFLKGFGIHVADSAYLMENMAVNSEEIVEKLGLPLFVKPCDSGSSFGIARVNEVSQLQEAVKNAFKEGRTVVIERFLNGIEVTCGVYRGREGVKALPLTEIVSKKEFFDYEAKYLGLSDEITPARINKEATARIQEVAKNIYGLLQLRSVARIDFMLVEDTPFVIEVNTTPGFSNESIVPKMIAAEGITIKDFWTEIVEAEL